MGRKASLTDAQIKTIMDLKVQDVPGTLIAERLGIPIHMVYATVSRQSRGIEPTYSYDEWKRRMTRMVELFEAGVTISELAKIFDCSQSNICHRLTNEGLDPEERREIRKGYENGFARDD